MSWGSISIKFHPFYWIFARHSKDAHIYVVRRKSLSEFAEGRTNQPKQFAFDHIHKQNPQRVDVVVVDDDDVGGGSDGGGNDSGGGVGKEGRM